METPSGKSAADENFPVGSWLLPARVRRHVAAFYAYARAIDDIADNPALEPAEKVERLDGFARAVSGADTTDPAFRKAHDIRLSLAETGVTHRHCVDLTRAFKQDATKHRYDDWDDLIGYCTFSAAPVGRYLVDLQGESVETYPASDALCNALQVLNHLQDCGDDYRALNRVYLPQDWMAEAGIGVEALAGIRSTAALRQVLDRCLDATDRLLASAEHLPGELRDTRFAMEAAVIVAIAIKLGTELRRRDPLAERVALTKAQYAACCARGIGQVLLGRAFAGAVRRRRTLRASARQREVGTVAPGARRGIPTVVSPAPRSVSVRAGPTGGTADPWVHVNRVVASSGTSFLWGMRVLPAAGRRAMHAIYAFCREVDDIADEPGESANKKRALAAWREEIGRLYAGQPEWPTTRALLKSVQRFDLPREEFLAVIDGMEIDAAPTVRMRDLDDLLGYCRKVAGSVGVLSVHAFGVPRHPGPQIAETLGNALQLTNILRDLREDAALQRLYVPQEMLDRHGVEATSLDAVLVHPGFAPVCEELAALARGYYREADRLLTEFGWRRMRPAVLMMAVYRETLDRLEERGWQRIGGPIRLTRARKMWLGLQYGFL